MIQLKSVFLSLLFGYTCFSYAQSGNCLTPVLMDDFSSSAGWQSQGDSSVNVSNGFCNFDDVYGRAYNRVYKDLGRSLSDTYWKAECDFSILSQNPVGIGSNGIPIAITAGDLPFISYDVSQNFQETNQDGIAVVLFSNSTTDNDRNNWYFLIEGKKGDVRSFDLATGIFADSSIDDYYIRLERASKDTVRLSVFSDSSFSTHLPDSPTSFGIDSTITELNTLQHGISTPSAGTRRLDARIDNDLICDDTPNLCVNVVLEEDFSTSANWQSQGDGKVNIDNGACNFDTVFSGSYNRVFRDLGRPLSDTYWKAECSFTILSPNPEGNGACGIPIALPAGDLDSISFDSSPNYLATTQDGLAVVLFSPNVRDNEINNWYFLIEGKKGDVRSFDLSTGIFTQDTVSDYYLRLERISSGIAKLSVFVDSTFRTHLSGSPAKFAIDSTITGLNTVQHGISTPGTATRRLHGKIDNDFICDDAIIDGIFDFAKETTNQLLVFPNPASTIIEFSLIDADWNPYNSSYKIFNLLGAEIDKGELNVSNQVDISTLENGYYLIQVRDANREYWVKFQKI